MLPRQNRVNKEKEINRFFGLGFKKLKGYSASSKFLLIKKLPNELSGTRFGFVVNLKYDKRATERNKIKRRLRDVAHQELDKVKNGSDYLVLVFPAAKTLEFEDLKKEFLLLLKKLRAY